MAAHPRRHGHDGEHCRHRTGRGSRPRSPHQGCPLAGGYRYRYVCVCALVRIANPRARRAWWRGATRCHSLPMLHAFHTRDRSVRSFCEGFDPKIVHDALAKQPPGLVLDVGAFDGADAVNYASAGHSVISFEPTPSKRRSIIERIRRSGLGANITFVPKAVSNVSGTIKFASHKGTAQVDQIDPPWLSAATNLSASLHIHPSQFRSISVPVTTLDEAAGDGPVLFVKIDTQGHDGLVVMGARRLISERRVRFLSMEVSPKLTNAPGGYVESVRLLEANGYSCMDCTKNWAPHPTYYSVRQVDWGRARLKMTVEERLEQLANRTPCDRMVTGCWTNLMCSLIAP